MAREFNGSNQYLEISNAVVNRGCTMSAWGNLNNITGLRDIVSVSSKTALAILRLSVNDGQFRILDQGDVNAIANGAIVSANQWNHFAGVFTNASSRTPYTNGIAGTTNAAAVAAITPTVTNIGAFFAGTATPLQFFSGRIAEVGIWDVALTSTEIGSLAKGISCDQIRPQSLVFYAPLVRQIIDVKGDLPISNNGGASAADHTRIYA